MPLSQLEANIVRTGADMAKMILFLKDKADKMAVDYDSNPDGAKYTIDQNGLDAVPAYVGLTKTELDDAMYAITSTFRTAIAAATTPLEKLAVFSAKPTSL